MADIDPIKAIIGLFVMILFGTFAVIILSTMSNVISQDQCKPYQEDVARLKIQSELDQIIINQTRVLLEQCRNVYNILANNSITKKDFEEVKGYFNLTQSEIMTINKKIDSIDRIYNYYNINIKNYSIALNIIFALEIISLLFLKNEFALAVFNWIRKKKKDKREQNETKRN